MIYTRKEGHAFVEVLHIGFCCRHFFSRSCSTFCLSQEHAEMGATSNVRNSQQNP
ncbi:hypothetical protein [Clostridium beijerinckii]|uniref:hypothetical protein n=1 Tax=Clostridium beijerinckii TaxID=1520 RepID=UPI001494E00B|nr:hypothetical protein [Clostridium beijerinckii]